MMKIKVKQGPLYVGSKIFLGVVMGVVWLYMR